MQLTKVMNKAAQNGVGMVEVLVALLVLAIGVLGYAGLQLSALKNSEDANNRAQATLIAQEALERFSANQANMATYLDETNWGAGASAAGGAPPGDCIGADCNGPALASWDIAQLRWQAANRLPNGKALTKSCDSSGDVSCVIVAWDDQNADACVSGGTLNTNEGSHCVVMEVVR